MNITYGNIQLLMGWKKRNAYIVRTYRKRWFVAFLLGLSVVAGLALWSACIRYAPFEESHPNSIVSVFKKRVDDAVLSYSDVRVVYHTGQTDGRSIDYWFSGMIVGYIDNPTIRKRLLTSAPFRSCQKQKDAECSAWGTFRDHNGAGAAEVSTLNNGLDPAYQLLGVPSDVFMPGRIRAPSVLNQAKSGQCIDIDSRHPQPLPPPGIDATGNVDFVTGDSVICVAPQNGAFVYAFSGHGV